MTIQDKNLNWSIKIGSLNKKIYPKERLEKFLSFDPKSEREVAEFCTEYQIIPSGLFLEEDNILNAFKKEQSIMQPIAQKIATGLELSKEDWDIINLNLGNIKKSKSIFSSTDINKFNQIRSGQIDHLPDGNYPQNTFTHGNTTASLWQDLSNLISSGLSACIGCGAYYRPVSGHHRKYCTPNCANRIRQEKYRAKKQ